jgi:plastocyanin
VGTDLRATILTSHASSWNLAIRPAVVTVSNAGYAAKDVTVRLGDAVRWSFTGTKPHSVTDTIKLGPTNKPWFDSGPRSSGMFGFAFVASGTFRYGSTVSGDGKLAGSVAVPVSLNATSIRVSGSVTAAWATRTMPGFAFDVEVRFKKANAKQWGSWESYRKATTTLTGAIAGDRGAGSYAVHARLRNTATGATGEWSPDVVVVVVP